MLEQGAREPLILYRLHLSPDKISVFVTCSSLKSHAEPQVSILCSSLAFSPFWSKVE
jgi:hypothetical protein